MDNCHIASFVFYLGSILWISFNSCDHFSFSFNHQKSSGQPILQLQIISSPITDKYGSGRGGGTHLEKVYPCQDGTVAPIPFLAQKLPKLAKAHPIRSSICIPQAMGVPHPKYGSLNKVVFHYQHVHFVTIYPWAILPQTYGRGLSFSICFLYYIFSSYMKS